MLTVYMDSVSEHQRDLTNSASARFLPEFIAGLVISSRKLSSVSKNLVVDKKKMGENFLQAEQLVVSEPLYILLAKHGHPNAHEKVRIVSAQARSQNKSVLETARKYLPARDGNYVLAVEDPLGKFDAKNFR